MYLRLLLAIACLLVFFCPLLPALSAEQESLLAEVDERVELLGIVFRLCADPSYQTIKIGNYAQDIDEYFAPFRKHAVVLFAKKLNRKNTFCDNAVINLALNLAAVPDLSPSILALSAKDSTAHFDKISAVELTRKLKNFCRDSKFTEFYKAHQELYRKEQDRANELSNGFDLDWFDYFFGLSEKVKFHLIVSLINANRNYSARNEAVHRQTDLYAIEGADDAQLATSLAELDRLKSDYQSSLAHEYSHTFINPLVDKYLSSLEASAQIISKAQARKMKDYDLSDPRTILCESLARAARITYYEAHGGRNKTLREIRSEQAAGFIWMDELFELLGKYNADKRKYPNFDSFMPEVSEFFRTYAEKMSEKQAAFDKKSAHVTSLEPDINHALLVKPELQELIVRFDKTMDPGSFSISQGTQGKGSFPNIETPEFIAGNQAIKLHLSLKPNQNYSFRLSSWSFRNADGYPLEDYDIEFQTGGRTTE